MSNDLSNATDAQNANAAEKVRRLVEGFRANIRTLKEEFTPEAVIRGEYIDRFWELLGWDIYNEAHRSTAEKDVVVEASVGTIETDRIRSRRPDYLFRIDGFPRFVVEAKKPIRDLRADMDAIFQAKTYAWSAQIPFAILTDFEEFRLFDATLKPYHDDPDRGVVADFDLKYSDYVEQWDVLEQTFSRSAVAGGSLERLLARVKHLRRGQRIRGIDRMLMDLRGSEPVDQVFLAHLEDYRQRIARTIYEQNRAAFPEANTRHGAVRLTEATQRLIDRIVFARVCEDRQITDWGELREIVNRAAENRQEVYPELVRHFRRMDAQYNGYLFKPHSLSEDLEVPSQLLRDFIGSLYLPDGPFRFDAIGDDILGIIYERFLGSTITVERGQVRAEEKPEVRHAGGVYYTPRFVVDTIIRRVIGPKIAGKSPADVLKVKILDPACGSGSFLVAAFQYLIDHCAQYIADHPSAAEMPASPRARSKMRKIAFEDADGQWFIAPDFKSQLLTSCLHGIDIDAQAVEVTIMSLYLKMLEGKFPPNWQRDWLEARLLPPLDNNIRCGNSLLSDTDFQRYWDNEHATLFNADEDTKLRMNAFDWTSQTRGFGRVIGSYSDQSFRGFDCIIGNPPYIRVQELNQWAPEECEFYKQQYKSAAKGNYDIYVVFLERGLQMLAADGLLGFICPHKFWQAKYGEGIRDLIARGKHLRSIIDFGDQQVFRGATTYTAIHVLGKEANGSTIDYARITELQDGDAQCRGMDDGAAPEGTARFASAMPPGDQPWRFEDDIATSRNERIVAGATMLLGALADRMFQGIRTSMNEVYIVRLESERSSRYVSESLSETVELEKDLLRPFLAGENIRHYEVVPPETRAIVPYRIDRRGDVQLIQSDEMKADFPKTWAYLKRNEKKLRQREQGRMDHDQWYGYVYPKNLDLFGTPRIVVRDIVEHASFALDESGQFAFVSGYGITIKPEHKTKLIYLLGLLNSRLLDNYLKSVSTTLRGGWFRPFPQFMAQLPIKLPATAGEKKIAEEIVHRVEGIMEAKVRLRGTASMLAGYTGKVEGKRKAKGELRGGGMPLSDQERERLEREVEAGERRIDELVCRLYGVDAMPAD